MTGIVFIYIFVLLGIIFLSNKKSSNKKSSNKKFANDRNNSRYLFLVSAECSRYQDWQIVGLYWSIKKLWNDAGYLRLLSCNNNQLDNYKYVEIVPTFICNNWSRHPETGDIYAPYNRPAALKEYFEKENPEQEYIIIIDPDTVLYRDMKDIRVEKGRPIAQRYEYLETDSKLQKIADTFCDHPELIQPVGMPIIIHKEDIREISKLWLHFTEKIRGNFEMKELAGWTAEMYGYCLAAAQLKIIHIIKNDLADRVPYNRIDYPRILHYDLKHVLDDYEWDKRYYRDIDVIEKNMQMPTPKNAPNDKYRYVFDNINEGLEKLNSS